MPGLSDSVIPFFMTTTCSLFVTAGSSPTFATFRCARVFTSVDLPTFGMPMIIARAVLRPLVGTASASQASVIRPRPSAARSVLTAIASTFPAPPPSTRRSRYSSHDRVTSGSARSLFVRTFTQGFGPRSSVTTGFSLARGILASSTSMTTSCDGMASAIARRALRIWPGYHWIDTRGSYPRTAGRAPTSPPSVLLQLLSDPIGHRARAREGLAAREPRSVGRRNVGQRGEARPRHPAHREEPLRLGDEIVELGRDDPR